MGTLTAQAKVMDIERQEYHAAFNAPAEARPDLYSKVVHKPDMVEDNMLDRKIEVSYNIEEEGKEAYIHVFEGRVVEWYGNARDVVGYKTRSMQPLALVQWDVEHDCEDCFVILDPNLYSKENKAGGWCMLGDEFVAWCEGLKARAGKEGRAQ